MASAWGVSWGASWGNSWGAISVEKQIIVPGWDHGKEHRSYNKYADDALIIDFVVNFVLHHAGR